MNYRKFVSTGMEVSEIGFGAWAIGGDTHGNSYGPTHDDESLRAVQAAVDLGCTFFDTADCYGFGHSEELLGKALGAVRKKVILATKGGSDFYHEPSRLNFTAEHLFFAVEQSLKRLGTDYIDVYQLHNPPFSLVEQGRLFEPLEKLKAQGKIRFYGVSIHDPQEGLMAMKTGQPDALQVVYNYLRRDAAEELFPRAIAEGVAIIAREPLSNGFLTGKYTKESVFPMGDIRHQWPSKYQTQLIKQVDEFNRRLEKSPLTQSQSALKFVLAQPAVTVVIPGCKTVAQTEENLNLPLPVEFKA